MNNWIRNVDNGQWTPGSDVLQVSDFDAFVQDVQSYRFYQKCLSGSTYVGVESVATGTTASSEINNLYGILNLTNTPYSYYFQNYGDLPYLQTFTGSIPQYPNAITSTSSLSNYMGKVLPDYNFTLKNLFTPDRLISDQIDNLYYVDIASTKIIGNITGNQAGLIIDGVTVKEGHRILIKDQYLFVTLPTSTDPSGFFYGHYDVSSVLGTNTTYKIPTSENGIYIFQNKQLVRTLDLDTYDQLLRYSVSVKLGDVNADKQFKLSRLSNGFYPQYQINTTYPGGPVGEPLYFEPTHNYVLRQQVDYNNLFELSLNDTLQHATQSLIVSMIIGSASATFSYTIPARTITVGEFGAIINTQEGVTNIVPSKYKVTLRSITQTSQDYWICGDSGIILKVDKVDFSISLLELDFVNNNLNQVSNSVLTSLTSIEFFNDLRGAAVGLYNQIWITNDGGRTWEQIYISSFNGYSYNKVIFSTIDTFYVGGDNGVFIEFSDNLGVWTPHKRRISRYIDGLEDEYLLVSNITDMSYFIDNSGYTNGIRDFVAISCELNNLFIYDISNSYSATWSFLAIEDGTSGSNVFGDISSITYVGGTYSEIFFSTPNGVYQVSPFSGTFSVGTTSNVVNPLITQIATQSSINKIFDYNDSELLITGNFGLWESTSNLSITSFSPVYDPSYFQRLRPRLLFMDYDIGSKVYWFDDSNQYRIPNRYGITCSYLQGGPTNSHIAFNRNTNTYFDGTTQSYLETNWITYWKDRTKTFEYYSNLDQPNVVETSFTFSSSDAIGMTFTYLNSDVTTSYNDIINLMPSAVPPMQVASLTQSSRFRDLIGIPLESPSNNYGLYFYDYLGIWNVPQMNSYTASIMGLSSSHVIYPNLTDIVINGQTYPIGFPLNAGSPTASSTLESILNSLGFGNIFTVYLSGFLFIFNASCTQNIISSLSCSAVHLSHSVSFLPSPCGPYPEVGDVLNISSDVFDGNFVINRIFSTSSVINTPATSQLLITSVPAGTYSIVVTDSLSNPIMAEISGTHSISQTILDISAAINASASVSGYSAIGLPLLNTIKITSPVIPSGTYYNGLQCNIEFIYGSTVSYSSTPFSGGSNYLNLEHYCYFYTDFNQNILNNIPSSTSGFTVRDLNKYPLSVSADSSQYFVDNFNAHYISYSYDCELAYDSVLGTQSFRIYPKYSQWSAYYNLQASVDVQDVNSNLYSDDIRYANGFLNFGYSPTYNLLSYLNFINPSEFIPSKEFYTMPNYIGIPGPGSIGASSSNIWIDAGTTTNKLNFGSSLKYIWDSYLKWVFVDINITQIGTTTTNRLLIVDKYYDSSNGWYVMVFHDEINYSIGVDINYVDILSRRSLQQVSDDLQYANGIQRPEWLVSESYDDISANITGTWSNFESNLKFKFPTDSYTKLLLSDHSVIRDLTGLIYTDYKNELSMQVTKLDRQYQFKPSNVSVNGSYYELDFPSAHLLNNNDWIIISPIGTHSSYPSTIFGYHNVTYVNDFSILIPIQSIGLFGPPDFQVSYVKKDYFLNFEPIDIFDLGVGDKLITQAVEINNNNWDVFGSTYSLFSLNLNKYKYRLIDGLDLISLSANFSWVLEAEISNAIIGLDSSNNLVWYDGIWFCGRWFGGTWISGYWFGGNWYSGVWTSRAITDNFLSVRVDNINTNNYDSIWYGGSWYGGSWQDGTWYGGFWYGGTWSNGIWYGGTWNDGLWENGQFQSGIWVLGEWDNGIFNQSNGPSYWLDGKFYGGDFENGVWYNGTFDEQNGNISRFGTKSINSQNSIWKSGKFLGGQFHSNLNVDANGNPDVSLIHKYSKWYTGLFGGGDFYGGTTYNINFKNTIWHGGISNDIEVLAVFTASNSIVLNGEFEFNINDEVYLVDNLNSGPFSVFGSTVNPIGYKVLRVNYDSINNLTYLNTNISLGAISSTVSGSASNLRCVSNFQSSTWNSGIWNNGVFIDGTFNGGLWYMGFFEGNWG